jgi:hypothetical protein
MIASFTVLTAFLTISASLANAQCLNQVAAYNPNLRTMTANFTWFIVPVPQQAVQTALKQAFPLSKLSLLDVSTNDIFPDGFPADKHPVLVASGLTDDIRISALQIDGGLMVGQIYAAYVKTSESTTPIAVSLNQYIAGENGPLPNGLVPAVASPLLFAGTPIRLGQFTPKSQAYQADAGGSLSASTRWALLPNPFSGPGAYPEAFDAIFRTTDSPRYSGRTFKSLINQPIFLPSGKCQRNTYYFNNATALPAFRSGQVTLGPAASGLGVTKGALQEASPDGSGVYRDVTGYSACAQVVGNNPQDCNKAAQEVDSVALS